MIDAQRPQKIANARLAGGDWEAGLRRSFLHVAADRDCKAGNVHRGCKGWTNSSRQLQVKF